MNHIKDSRLSPLLKYPGGKEKELPIILPAIPSDFKDYYEPFVGGGAVYWSVNAQHYYINDAAKKLIHLYSLIKEQDMYFLSMLYLIDEIWGSLDEITDNHAQNYLDLYKSIDNFEIAYSKLIAPLAERLKSQLDRLHIKAYEIFKQELFENLLDKLHRLEKLQNQSGNFSKEDLILNLCSAQKMSFYNVIRELYNNEIELNLPLSTTTACFAFLRDYCYSSMFRYNKQGKFNVPFGGISYCKRRLTKRLLQMQNPEAIKQLQKTTLGNEDFRQFLKRNSPKKDDFVFLDPPYDTTFSSYAQLSFTQDDHKRLSRYLIKECKARFILVIKNTPFIAKLYKNGCQTLYGKLQVKDFESRYRVSFRNRNDHKTQHLLISNFKIK